MAAAKRRGPAPRPATSAYDASWRRLHPVRAAEERGFRKDKADRDRRYAARDKLQDEGTPETRAKARVHAGALARLYTGGHITIDQLASSQEIRLVIERLGADVKIGTFSLETRVDQSRHGEAFFEKLGAVRAEIAYTRWRERPGATALIAAIAEDLSIEGTARLMRVRRTRAHRIISDLLDAWREDIRTACREVDHGDLLAAHAGLM